MINFSRPHKHWYESGRVPRHRTEGALEIAHPRWLYLPGLFNSSWLAAQLIRPALRIRRQFAFDIIDAHFGYPDGIAAWLLAAALRRPFVITLRGSELLHVQYRSRRYAMRQAIRHAARVITVSNQLRELAISLGATPGKVVVIPNGIDTNTFGLRDREECRAALGISKNAKAILCAGHLIALKGHDRVAAALTRLLNAHPSLMLFIAGGQGHVRSSYAEQLGREIAQQGLAGHVRFLGEVSATTLCMLMNAADVFCLASSREGWPNVVHEALACGTPVVATSVGAVQQLLPSPKYGFIVPVDNQDALNAALGKALTQDWDREIISQWGRSRSWSQVGSEVVAELRRAVSEWHAS